MTTLFSYSDIHETAIDVIDDEKDNTVPAPIDLHVNKLNYTVTDKIGTWWQKLTHFQMPWEWFGTGTTNHILQDVTFTVKSGQLMAIMGGSGSGKTSLLDVISCRTSNGTITGEVYLNSAIRTQTLLDTCSGYVRQDDRLIGSLTARETLMFVARLKLPRTFTTDMIRHRVNMIIAELGLKHAADTKVGSADIRGLSGGERRRVSIGIQLLILPSLLFLDEPTSGLDSFTARNLVKTLSRLTVKKRTIIMSIHQPRFDIFSLVDTLMILSKGRIVYNGPGKEIVPYFASLGYPCPPHTNPCDFCIDLATVDYTSQELEESSLKVVQILHDTYQATEKAIQVTESEQLERSADNKVNDISKQMSRNNVVEDVNSQMDNVVEDVSSQMDNVVEDISSQTTRNRLRTSSNIQKEQEKQGSYLIEQFYILFKRFIRVKADNYSALLSHLIQALLMSLLLGLVYKDLSYDEQSIRDWMSIMFIIIVLYPYTILLSVIEICHEERRFLYFELQDNLYTPAAYYFAKIFSEVPFHLVHILVYCIPMYIMAGLKADAYTCCMLFIFMAVSVFTTRSLAMMAATIMPTYQTSCLFAQSLFTFMIFAGGFFINLNSMLDETKWLTFASYIRWSYQALCIIGIESLEFHCNTTSECGGQLKINGRHSGVKGSKRADALTSNAAIKNAYSMDKSDIINALRENMRSEDFNNENN